MAYTDFRGFVQKRAVSVWTSAFSPELRAYGFIVFRLYLTFFLEKSDFRSKLKWLYIIHKYWPLTYAKNPRLGTFLVKKVIVFGWMIALFFRVPLLKQLFFIVYFGFGIFWRGGQLRSEWLLRDCFCRVIL
jgi:hypothetical protein